jgi:hypothetical protein
MIFRIALFILIMYYVNIQFWGINHSKVRTNEKAKPISRLAEIERVS